MFKPFSTISFLLIFAACKPPAEMNNEGNSEIQSGSIGFINKTLGLFGGQPVRSFLWSFPLAAVVKLDNSNKDQDFSNKQNQYSCWYRLNVEDPSYFSPQSLQELNKYVCNQDTKILSPYAISTDHFEAQIETYKKDEHLKFWTKQLALTAATAGICPLAVGSIVGTLSCSTAIGYVSQLYNHSAGRIDGGGTAALKMLQNQEKIPFDGIEAIDRTLKKIFEKHLSQLKNGNKYPSDYISVHGCPAPKSLPMCQGRPLQKFEKPFGLKADGAIRALCYKNENGTFTLKGETAGLTDIPSGSITGRIDHIDDKTWGRMEIIMGGKVTQNAGRTVTSPELTKEPQNFVIRAYAVDPLWKKEMKGSSREKTFSTIKCTTHF